MIGISQTSGLHRCGYIRKNTLDLKLTFKDGGLGLDCKSHNKMTFSSSDFHEIVSSAVRSPSTGTSKIQKQVF